MSKRPEWAKDLGPEWARCAGYLAFKGVTPGSSQTHFEIRVSYGASCLEREDAFDFAKGLQSEPTQLGGEGSQ